VVVHVVVLVVDVIHEATPSVLVVVKHHDISVNIATQDDVPDLPARAQIHLRPSTIPMEGEPLMALGDKISNAAEQAAGKAKESAGDAKGDDRLKAEGQNDQTAAKAKKVGEDVKDVFR
jgi:uncharacterized protein YjbJ (UPF0337 family)